MLASSSTQYGKKAQDPTVVNRTGGQKSPTKKNPENFVTWCPDNTEELIYT